MSGLRCSLEADWLSDHFRNSTCKFQRSCFPSLHGLNFSFGHIWGCLIKYEVYYGNYHFEALTYHWGEELLSVFILHVTILEECMQIWDAVHFKASGEGQDELSNLLLFARYVMIILISEEFFKCLLHIMYLACYIGDLISCSFKSLLDTISKHITFELSENSIKVPVLHIFPLIN